jgi:hypothetical protein
LVEHRPFKPGVLGSTPRRLTSLYSSLFEKGIDRVEEGLLGLFYILHLSMQLPVRPPGGSRPCIRRCSKRGSIGYRKAFWAFLIFCIFDAVARATPRRLTSLYSSLFEKGIDRVEEGLLGLFVFLHLRWKARATPRRLRIFDSQKFGALEQWNIGTMDTAHYAVY